MRVAAIVVAAGRGERLGHALPKAFVPLCGRTLLARAVAALAASDRVDAVLPVLPAGMDPPRDAAHPKLLAAVAGGERRQDSVAAGLAALPDGVEFVAVHDAARALVRTTAVTRVIDAAIRHGAALLAVPARDTVKRVRAGVVVETPPRDECFAAQTPQVFRIGLLREALDKARAEGRTATDCAQLVEALGVSVHVVPGDPDNWKITDAGDLAAAERALGARSASFAQRVQPQVARSEPKASEGHQTSRSEPKASEGHQTSRSEPEASEDQQLAERRRSE